MAESFELYEGKSYSDLLKDIVKNQKNKQKLIKDVTERILAMINEPEDTIVYVPLIKQCLDADIKNDELLVKLAGIVQKSADTKEIGGGLFTDKDLQDLFSEVQSTTILPDDSEIKKLIAPSTNG
jgi:hypothetical protein